MKNYLQYFLPIILIFILIENVHPEDLPNKFYLKSGTVLMSSKLKVEKYGFKDSKIFEIDYQSLDSVVTNDTILTTSLIQKFNVLQVTNRPAGMHIKGFEKIRRNALNFGMELWGRTFVGGTSLNFIYKEQHSVEIGYGNGEASTGLFSDVKAKNIYYLSYSYLYGRYSSKLELGAGFSYGKVTFRDIFLSSDTTGYYEGLMISSAVGYRYQRSKSGIYFKTGVSPILFTKPDVGLTIFIYMGFGYTFVL